MSDLVTEVREAFRDAPRLPPPAIARAIREATCVTQDRMADELGVHRVTLARWEAGTRAPRGQLRARYATLLAQLQQAIGS